MGVPVMGGGPIWGVLMGETPVGLLNHRVPKWIPSVGPQMGASQWDSPLNGDPHGGVGGGGSIGGGRGGGAGGFPQGGASIAESQWSPNNGVFL